MSNTADQWLKKMAEVADAEKKQAQLEAVTLAFIQPGDAPNEKSFNQQGEDTTPDRFLGRPARRGKKWFSYDVPIEASRPVAVVVTYHSEERSKRMFEILADGNHIGAQTIERSGPGSAAGKFFDVEYKIPVEILSGKTKITLRFSAKSGSEIAAVYGVRLIRSDAER